MQLHPILHKLGMTNPIFQAPIGGVASPELAASVSEAGGLGHLACTWRSADQLETLFDRMASLTRRPFGANFVLDFPIEERLKTALAHKIRVISFFWGDGGRYVTRVKAAGAIAIQVVGTIGEAKRAAEAGFDVIVAQGFEAGGHVRGEMGLMALLPQVVDAVSPVPVLAAGGIADRRGVRAAFALGAAGVWVGTRFLAADEASIHPCYRDRVFASDGDDTVCAKLFDIGWPDAPARSLVNSTVVEWRAAKEPQSPHRPGEREVIAHRADGTPLPRYHFSAPTQEITGAAEAMALYAGADVGLVVAKAPAARIVDELAAGAEDISRTAPLTQARQEDVAPRAAPLDPPYGQEIQEEFRRIMGSFGDPLLLFRTVAKHRRAWSKFRAGSLLDDGPLTLRQREIIIARTCALTRCEYEWGVHIAFFAKKAGLTQTEVEATITGNVNIWHESERALINAVDALHFRATWSDDEYRALSSHYTEAQIFEILLLCGRYHLVAYVANGLALPLDRRAARFSNSLVLRPEG